MITLLGRENRYGMCDGISRRDFLTIGGLSLGAGTGWNLAQMLEAEAAAGVGSSNKSVIMIFLVGGASHIDMFDRKPDAPAEVRGAYDGIPTNVPGIDFVEHLPRLARVMDRMVLLRSLVGGTEAHAANICLTGEPPGAREQVARPSFGSVVSHVQGTTDAGVPPFISLTPKMKHGPWCLAGPPATLGPAHAPFQPFRSSQDQTLLRDMTLGGIGRNRLASRRSLLNDFDTLRREFDHSGAVSGMDKFQKQAFEVLTSRKLVEALDVEREDPRVRERYGRGSMSNVGNGAPHCNHHFLIARRLVEAGARVVSLAWGHWDWHSKQYDYLKADFPPFDQGLSALIEDLYLRGLDKDVMVVVWGEMGRTPRINNRAGRDHWPAVSSALLAGGGMPTGQVIGATDATAAYVTDRPVHYQNVFATCYHHLGVFPQTKTFVGEFSGLPEPRPILDRPHPILELIS